MMVQLRSCFVGASSSRSFVVSASLFALATAGCGADWEEPAEEYDTLQAELSSGDLKGCFDAPPDQIFVGKVDPPFSTPRQYANCGQTYIVGIEDLDAQYTDPPPRPGATLVPAKIAVTWGGVPPTSSLACTRSSLSAIFYYQDPAGSGGGGIYFPEQPGVWLLGTCQLELSLRTYQQVGWDFKVAAQAKYLGQLRKAKIGTYKAVVIPDPR